MKRIGTKRCKISIFGQKPRGGIGTTQQNPFGTCTDTSGTGSTMHNVFGTGTKHSGTGTTESKNPDFCSFAYLRPNSYTVSMGTLMND